MKRLAILIPLLLLSAAKGEIPKFFQEKDFSSASFAEAVNYFVNMGEDAAVLQLQELNVNPSVDRVRAAKFGHRIAFTCRVLFQSKGHEPLEPPALGALVRLPYHSMPSKAWPLFPVALSGSTYFILSDGYAVGGFPEPVSSYIEYCRKNGLFRIKPIPVPDRQQALKDAAALRSSAEWKALKWTDQGENWYYSLSEPYAWQDIQQQADLTPTLKPTTSPSNAELK